MSPASIVKVFLTLAMVSSLSQPGFAAEMKTMMGSDGVERLVDPRTGKVIETENSNTSGLQNATYGENAPDQGGFIQVKGGGGGGGSSSGSSRQESRREAAPRADRVSKREEKSQDKNNDSKDQARADRAQAKQDQAREDRAKSKQDQSRDERDSKGDNSRRGRKNADSVAPGQSTQAAKINNEANGRQPVYSNQYSQGEFVKDKKGNEIYQKTNKDTHVVTQFTKDDKGRNVKTDIYPSGKQETRVPHKDGKGFTNQITEPNGQKKTEQIRVRQDGTTAITRDFVDKNTGNHITELPSGAKRIKNAQTGDITFQKPRGDRIEKQGNTKQYFDSKGRNVYTETRTQIGRNTYVQRTTIYNNRTYVNSYHPYTYGGYGYNSYTPFFWYPTSYYSYMYNPWVSPYSYTWGYVPYNYYFTPMVVYTHPMAWLADYMVIEALADAASDRAATQQVNTATQAAVDASRDVSPGQSKSCTTEKSMWGGSKETCTVTAAPSAQSQSAQEEISEKTVKPAKATPISEGNKTELKGQLEGLVKLHQEKQAVTMGYALEKKLMVTVREDEQDFKGFVLGADGQPSSETCDFSSGDLVRFTSSIEGSSAIVLTVVAGRGEGCDAGDKVVLTGEQGQDLLNLYSQTLEKGLAKMQKDEQLKKAGVPTDAPQINAEDKGEAPAK